MKWMLRLLFVFVLLSVSALAQNFVQAKNCTATNVTKSCAVSIVTTLGNMIEVCGTERLNNTDTLAITDSAGQTGWTQTVSGYAAVGTSNRAACFVRPNSAALTTATCTWTTGTSALGNCIAFEFSGMVTASAEDSSVNNLQSVVTTATSGAITTTNPNDACTFFTGLSGAYSSPAAGASYTLPVGADTASRSFMDYSIVSATQSAVTTTSTWVTSLNDANIFACFKGVAVAAKGFGKRDKLTKFGVN